MTQENKELQPAKINYPEELIEWVPEDGFDDEEDLIENKKESDNPLDGVVGDQGC